MLPSFEPSLRPDKMQFGTELMVEAPSCGQLRRRVSRARPKTSLRFGEVALAEDCATLAEVMKQLKLAAARIRGLRFSQQDAAVAVIDAIAHGSLRHA